ncbi:hypothetical protein SAMN02745248_00350 [Hathewaya proteolytica DSM 3090]|uniref:Uncharacterized protein n=1 Tax=Hathewaya proteolytica DSM 3090 TaxID=1121331 RepID=A0A1M6K6C4_9CLOT|nr:hypothetical protein [Hathewaya proteolytica]SHJ54457.1 hypothetical protein SAMN02745248_00350 [Hathewaya proteolytica DSM 3090]
MDIGFLESHHIRMKKIGAYALLFRNSIEKKTWKKYGFEEGYEQDNLIFAVLLYVMEQSLKEEICTIDNISVFIDELNNIFFKKEMTYEDCKGLSEFIINTVLCDEGRAMYFRAFNFKDRQYEDINISFIRNKIEYVDGVRRVVYALTDEGYSLILSTLEVEENLKITIDEIIFKMHLEKADYDKAVNDIKNIFNQFRIRVQKIEDDIRRIKENPLAYSVAEYRNITEGNLELLWKSKEKFVLHRENVNEKIKEFHEKDINIQELNEEEKQNLDNLKTIKEYLGRTIDEDQRILLRHYDLKEIYGKELEDISKMTLIDRFNLKTDVYDKVIKDISKLENIHIFFRPLFIKDVKKRYNLNKALTYDMARKSKGDTEEEILGFDEEEFMEEEHRRKAEKLKRYKDIIKVILEFAETEPNISLKEISTVAKENGEIMKRLIPNVRMFREVIIEMLKSKEFHIDELIRERRVDYIEDNEYDFQLTRCILDIIYENKEFSRIKYISVAKNQYGQDISLEGLRDEDGREKKFICSDVIFTVR